jgi:hypothetical protein
MEINQVAGPACYRDTATDLPQCRAYLVPIALPLGGWVQDRPRTAEGLLAPSLSVQGLPPWAAPKHFLGLEDQSLT